MSTEQAHELIVVEYEQLKAEQRSRIGLRDNLIYVTLAAYAAIMVAVLTAPAQTGLLLVLPVAATVLGWTHLTNDEKISAVGHYVRRQLVPRLEVLHPDDAPVFAWEEEHRRDRRRQSRKSLQLAADLATFTVPALAALLLYWGSDRTTYPLTVASIVELAATAVLAWQRILHADLLPLKTTRTPRSDLSSPSSGTHRHGCARSCMPRSSP